MSQPIECAACLEPTTHERSLPIGYGDRACERCILEETGHPLEAWLAAGPNATAEALEEAGLGTVGSV